MSPMLIEIPDLTPELCEARAEYMRKWDCTPEERRARADAAAPDAAAICLFDAALMEQYPARPELKVGDLATTSGSYEVRVDYIGQERAFCTYPNGGGECSWRLSDLTYSRPCPEGWPEDDER